MRKKTQQYKKKNWVFLALILVVAYFFDFEFLSPAPLALPGQSPHIYCTQTGDQLQDTLIAGIKNAKTSVLLMIYALKDAKIIKILNDKAEAGIPVQIIYDAKASEDVECRLVSSIQKFPRVGNGLMHLKILVVDAHYIWLGSANITRDSLKKHANLIAHLDQPDFAAYLIKKANRMTKGHFESPLAPYLFQLENQDIEMRFLPDDQTAVDRLVKMLNEAKKTIKVAMFTFTRTDLADCLVAAKERGVSVEVVIDQSTGMEKGASSKIAKYLQQKNIPVTLSNKDGIMHHKFVWIDGKILAHGSANWTKAAFKQNDDYIMILTDLNADQKKVLHELWNKLTDKIVKFSLNWSREDGENGRSYCLTPWSHNQFDCHLKIG